MCGIGLIGVTCMTIVIFNECRVLRKEEIDRIARDYKKFIQKLEKI